MTGRPARTPLDMTPDVPRSASDEERKWVGRFSSGAAVGCLRRSARNFNLTAAT
jgi:hypothetical protein